MSKWFNYILGIALLFSSCSRAQERLTMNNLELNSSKILIVYLSRTQNTKAVAEIIHQKIGGDLVELELENPYPENYQQIVAQVQKENETEFLPELKTKIDSIEKYDVIFIGFPTWGMQLPPPVKSLLSQINFTGKTIVPFNTNAGYGLGNSIETIKNLSPNSIILEEYSTKGEKEVKVSNEIDQWLKKINIIK